MDENENVMYKIRQNKLEKKKDRGGVMTENMITI